MKTTLKTSILIVIALIFTNISYAQYSEGFEGEFYPAGWSGDGFVKSSTKKKSGTYSAESSSSETAGSSSYLKINSMNIGIETKLSFNYCVKSGTTNYKLNIYIITNSASSEESKLLASLKLGNTSWESYEISFPSAYNNTNGNAIIFSLEKPKENNKEEETIYIDDVTSEAPLPVGLEYFSHTVKNNKVNLQWKTTFEINNLGFDIERNSDNKWDKVGFIPASIGFTYSYEDKNLQPGTYKYRLKQIDFNGNYEYFTLEGNVVIGMPSEYKLGTNYPNPFNPSTKINYLISKQGKVTIKVFDITGKEYNTGINNKEHAPGTYNLNFDGSQLSSGVYFYSMFVDGIKIDTKKMTLIK